MLKEIILVDDYSDIGKLRFISSFVSGYLVLLDTKNCYFTESLHEDLENYISKNNDLKRVVHLHKTSKREGLIRARIFGANLATGEVNYIYVL